MQRHVMMFAGLGVLVVSGTVLMRPPASVRFETELAAIEPEDALQQLGDADPALVATENIALLHFRLALAAADTRAVRGALGNLAGLPDLTALIEEQLSEAAKLDGDLPLAARHLQKAYDAEPTVARRLQLGLWLRFLRDAPAELALLESVAPSALTPGEAERLAQLLLGARRFDALDATYRLLADSPDRVNDIFRQRLIDLRVEGGRAAEAVSTVLEWFAEDGNGASSIELAVPVMLARGAVDEAYFLATTYMDAAHDDSHAMILNFARSGHRAIAIALQDRWLARARDISPEAWQTLIGFANTTGDPRGLRAALAMVGPGTIDAGILNDALSQILRYQGVDALTPYRDYLAPGFMDAAPLIGAAWAGRQGRQEQAAAYLMQAAQGDLSAWEVEIWLQIASGLSGGPAYRALLLNGTGDARIDGRLGGRVISAAQAVPNQ